MFRLIVNNFDIEYVGKRHACCLLISLGKSYRVTTNWNGKNMRALISIGNIPNVCAD